MTHFFNRLRNLNLSTKKAILVTLIGLTIASPFMCAKYLIDRMVVPKGTPNSVCSTGNGDLTFYDVYGRESSTLGITLAHNSELQFLMTDGEYGVELEMASTSIRIGSNVITTPRIPTLQNCLSIENPLRPVFEEKSNILPADKDPYPSPEVPEKH